MTRIYLVVTADELELPLYVADTMGDLCERMGYDKQQINYCIRSGCIVYFDRDPCRIVRLYV